MIISLNEMNLICFCFQDLESAPSCDAVVRERISKLPPEIADVSLLSQLKGYYCLATVQICIILKLLYVHYTFSIIYCWNCLYSLTFEWNN